MEERELLLRSLKGYLTDLADSGIDELAFGPDAPVAAPAPPASLQGAEPVAVAAPASVAVAAPTNAAPTAIEPVCRQEGSPRARLLFLMRGPGYTGAAGDLLTKIIAGMKFRTDEVCLLSFDAGADAAALADIVRQRLDAVAPELVVALGEEAAGLLLATPFERVRGEFQELRGRAVMPTLHPDALLADDSLKRQVWEEMKLVMRRLAGAA